MLLESEIKGSKLLCEKLGTQNTHLAITENVKGVVSYKSMLVGVNKGLHSALYINCSPMQHIWQRSQWYQNTNGHIQNTIEVAAVS